LVTERIRRGKKALKTTRFLDAKFLRERGGENAGNAKRARAPKGVPIAVEE